MYYLKLPDRLNLTDDGISMPDNKRLILSFKRDNKEIDAIKSLFSNIESITVYGCVVQDDGKETDEFVANYFEQYTMLKGIEYDVAEDLYKVTLTIPDEIHQRLSELEDVMNFLLMGE